MWLIGVWWTTTELFGFTGAYRPFALVLATSFAFLVSWLIRSRAEKVWRKEIAVLVTCIAAWCAMWFMAQLSFERLDEGNEEYGVWLYYALLMSYALFMCGAYNATLVAASITEKEKLRLSEAILLTMLIFLWLVGITCTVSMNMFSVRGVTLAVIQVVVIPGLIWELGLWVEKRKDLVRSLNGSG